MSVRCRRLAESYRPSFALKPTLHFPTRRFFAAGLGKGPSGQGLPWSFGLGHSEDNVEVRLSIRRSHDMPVSSFLLIVLQRCDFDDEK